jgi:hypothetical protein
LHPWAGTGKLVVAMPPEKALATEAQASTAIAAHSIGVDGFMGTERLQVNLFHGATIQGK